MNEGCSNEFNSITAGDCAPHCADPETRGEQVNRGEIMPIGGHDAGERAERFVACDGRESGEKGEVDEREEETRIGIRE